MNSRHASLIPALVGFLLALPLAAETDGPTWSHDIAPLLFQHCLQCHRPGGAAPFSLDTYTAAAKRASFLNRAVESGYMPPWPADSPTGAFSRERRLSEHEKSVLRKWARSGAPAGDLATAPEPPEPPSGDWPRRRPDLILSFPDPYRLEPAESDTYRAFVLPFSFDVLSSEILEAARIPGSDILGLKGFALRTSHPRILHHALAYVDTGGQARKLDAGDPGPGYATFGDPGFPPDTFLGTYAPGQTAQFHPPAVAEPVPSKGDLVLLTHLTNFGKTEDIHIEIGLYLTREPVMRVNEWVQLGSYAIDIPPGVADYTIQDQWKLPVDAFLLAVFPHMHFLGRSVRSWAILPDGSRYNLLQVNRWDFNWQLRYAYRQPVSLPAGSILHAEWVYDNSGQNPRNPHTPPRRVSFGPNSSDEMCEFHFDLVPAQLDDYPRLRQARDSKMRQLLSDLPRQQAGQ
jgi:hypothetical protein